MTDAVASEHETTKVEIELEPWQAELLSTFNIPDGLCGPSLAERAAFILTEWCESVQGARERYATHPHDFEDDDAPCDKRQLWESRPYRAAGQDR